ncbi:MAG TPA: YdjY domain-containing protein, partial [Isosphaeraceae bacterium]
TGAEPGHPVRFLPKFEPPAGTPIAIDLEWAEAGSTRHDDARRWIKDQKLGSTLDRPWVFAGSQLIRDPDSDRTFYAADDGDLITVSNFTAAILDLPFASSADDQERSFVANTPRLPPLGTPVTLILQPDGKGARP